MPEQSMIQEYRPFPIGAHDASLEITGHFDRLIMLEKTKNKTRGQAAHSPMIVDDIKYERDLDIQEPQNITITVDKRSHKVFKTLLRPTPADLGEIPKAVKWDDFKRAMVRAGFSAQKLRGSAWQFMPASDQAVTRGIQFHEPHPDNEIPYAIAKRFGRRLERVYGWSANTFTLA